MYIFFYMYISLFSAIYSPCKEKITYIKNRTLPLLHIKLY